LGAAALLAIGALKAPLWLLFLPTFLLLQGLIYFIDVSNHNFMLHVIDYLEYRRTRQPNSPLEFSRHDL
jgi:hypothetical protein